MDKREVLTIRLISLSDSADEYEFTVRREDKKLASGEGSYSWCIGMIQSVVGSLNEQTT